MLTKDLTQLKLDWNREINHYDNRHLRAGQMFFNMLYERFPIIANSIRGDNTLDPFYVDSRLTACFRHLAKIAYENDIKYLTYGNKGTEEKEEKKTVEEVVLSHIKKRLSKKDIPRANSEMGEGQGRVGTDLQ